VFRTKVLVHQQGWELSISAWGQGKSYSRLAMANYSDGLFIVVPRRQLCSIDGLEFGLSGVGVS